MRQGQGAADQTKYQAGFKGRPGWYCCEREIRSACPPMPFDGGQKSRQKSRLVAANQENPQSLWVIPKQQQKSRFELATKHKLWSITTTSAAGHHG